MSRHRITTPSGLNADITDKMNRLLGIAHSRDFEAKYRRDFLKNLGWRIISAAGEEAPGQIIAAYAEHLPPEFSAHLAALWEGIAAECREE